MQALLTILAIIFLVIVVICIWKTVEYFNLHVDTSKYKILLAYDILVMFMLAVALIIKIAFD